MRPTAFVPRLFGPTLLAWLALLAGCGNRAAPAPLYERLLERLANVTGVEIPPGRGETALPAYPRPRDLALPEADLRIGFGDLIGLGQCHLLGEISDRNSALGRVRAPSTRLWYDLRLYRGVTECLDIQTRASTPDRDFIALLRSIESGKRANLPVAFWNATFAGPEFRDLLNTAADALPTDADPSVADLRDALDHLTRIGRDLLSGTLVVESAELEPRLRTLRSGRLVGPLLRGMVVSLDYLDRGSRLLETAADQRRLCPAGRRTQGGEYLANVFRKFYIGEAQPYLSRLHRTARPIFDSLEALAAAQGVVQPPAFTAFHAATLDPAAPESVWASFNAGIARHTRAWQTLLRQCGRLPAGPPA